MTWLAQTQTPEASGILAMLWAFANSPAGMTILSTACLAILGKVFTAKPEWFRILLAHKGVFFDACRWAEKAIPDGTPNVAMARADAALKFILEQEPRLKLVDEATIRRAISVAHGEAEKAGKLELPPTPGT